ncbi:MAG: hypothetical protein U5J99_14800 [Parvularculaceae bacterium]|nr:hypothetical protein [Parvularculaceae bacterium]
MQTPIFQIVAVGLEALSKLGCGSTSFNETYWLSLLTKGLLSGLAQHFAVDTASAFWRGPFIACAAIVLRRTQASSMNAKRQFEGISISSLLQKERFLLFPTISK